MSSAQVLHSAKVVARHSHQLAVCFRLMNKHSWMQSVPPSSGKRDFAMGQYGAFGTSSSAVCLT